MDIIIPKIKTTTEFSNKNSKTLKVIPNPIIKSPKFLTKCFIKIF
tara:strand:- start:7408 stop:7542 length:135 start_codon:yes stop_codon:yes gene_type:complete